MKRACCIKDDVRGGVKTTAHLLHGIEIVLACCHVIVLGHALRERLHMMTARAIALRKASPKKSSHSHG